LPKVIVTDSSERTALAVIRSLGRRGIEVVAADSISFNMGFLSKYCSRRIIYPLPQKNKSKFIDALLSLVKNEKFDLLIPITDFTMIPILERRDEIEEHVKVAAPPYKTAIEAFDKAQTIKIAEEHGIPCPRTFFLNDIKDTKEVAESIRYPAVIKPRMKVLWIGEGAITLKVTSRNYAYSSIDLITKYARMMSQLGRFNIPDNFFLAQEFVDGQGYGVEVLIHDSELKAIFIHRRLREYPITGGASTLRVSVKNEKIKKYALDMLSAMGWQGVAMVEFKLDEKNNDAWLLEVNGRFWGSLPLAISAGVDFPYLLYKTMMGENVAPCYSYRVGVTQRWLIPGDLLWLFASFQDNRRGKLHNLIEFLSSSRTPDDIISSSDVSPALGAIGETLHYFFDVIRGSRTIYGESTYP
jgi:predicted ATP-grasp superfamily ATP-dependent carboligase